MEPNEQQLELLGALEALGGSAGNGKLRELMGWDEPTYEAVKGGLVASGELLMGRGRGGSVSLGNGDGPLPQARSTPGNGSRGPSALQPPPPPGPSPAASRTSRPSSGAWLTCCGATTSRAITAR